MRKLPNKEPMPGDIVITCVGDPPLSYSVSGASFHNVTCTTYDGALDVARQQAMRLQVDVWVDEGRDDVTLVARHRP
jgi:hypothetical protein